MAYEVYITRASSPSEEGAPPITQDEWAAVVAADPELQWSREDYYDRKVPGTQKKQRIHPVIWIGPAGPKPLWLIDGSIQMKSPDEPTRRKMAQIAAKLGARVLGEEGETYDPDGKRHSPS